MNDINIKTNYTKGILNEVYCSRENLKEFMHVTDMEETKFIIYGLNNHSKYYAVLSSKIVYPKIEFFVNDSSEDIKSLKGYQTKTHEEFKEYLKLYKNKVKVIVFSDDYTRVVKQLQELGLDSFKQIFDGRYIFDMREFDTESIRESDDISRIIYSSESHYLYKGGIYVVDVQNQSHTKIMEGDFRGLRSYKNGYLALDDKQGLLFLNSKFEVEKLIKIDDADLHGIDVLNENSPYIFVTETAFDRISVFNIETGIKEEQIEIAGKNVREKGLGMYHINDILIKGDEILVSMASMRGLFHRGAFKDDGAVVSMNMKDYVFDKVYADKLNSPHSLIKAGENILFCDSGKGNIYCNGEVIHKLNGFIRGLHFNGYALYVGQNIPRHLPYLMQTSKNFSNDSGIHSFIPSRRVSTFKPFSKIKQVYGIITE